MRQGKYLSPKDTMDLLATTALLVRLDELQAQLNTIEQAMNDAGSSQGTLDEAWTKTTREMDEIVEILANAEMNKAEDTRGCQQCSGCAYCDDTLGQYDPRDEI